MKKSNRFLEMYGTEKKYSLVEKEKKAMFSPLLNKLTAAFTLCAAARLAES